MNQNLLNIEQIIINLKADMHENKMSQVKKSVFEEFVANTAEKHLKLNGQVMKIHS